MIKHYSLQILIAIDQLANTFLGGWADETISSRCYRCSDKWYWLWLMTLLDFAFLPFETQHCKKSYESERENRHLPPELR